MIEPIGTSLAGRSGHSPLNIVRLTEPCSWATPLRRAARRNAITAMLNFGVLVAVLVGAHADAEQLVDRHAALGGEAAEVLLDQRPLEAVDAGRHRRVRGEHAARPHRLDGGVERQPGGDELADPLEAEEPGVALVAVEHLRVDAEGPQRAHAADAEDDLLAQAVVRVAAVEPVGDRDAVGGVALDVGVEQVQGDLADVGAPDPDRDVVAGEVDRHADAGVGEPERLADPC